MWPGSGGRPATSAGSALSSVRAICLGIPSSHMRRCGRWALPLEPTQWWPHSTVANAICAPCLRALRTWTRRPLSLPPAARPLRGSRDPPAIGLLDQQLHHTGTHRGAIVQEALASGIVLPLDQATPADQGVLWNVAERGEDPNLDRDQCLCAGGHREEATRAIGQPLQFSTGFRVEPVRKNAHFTAIPARICPPAILHPV